MNKKVKEVKKDALQDMIINEALKRQKNGELKTGLDVENFLDNLLQPLMQGLLDGELDNHLDYKRYEHAKKTIVVMVIAKRKLYKPSMEV